MSDDNQTESVHDKSDQVLLMAVLNGHDACVAELLTSGMKNNIHYVEENDLLLYVAVRDKHYKITKTLLMAGFNVHVHNNMALYTALSHNDYKMVKLLLKYKANPDDRALTIAIGNNNCDIVRVLLRYGANLGTGESKNHLYRIHSRRDHALAMAIRNRSYDIIQLLLDHSIQQELNYSHNDIESFIYITKDAKIVNMLKEYINDKPLPPITKRAI